MRRPIMNIHEIYCPVMNIHEMVVSVAAEIIVSSSVPAVSEVSLENVGRRGLPTPLVVSMVTSSISS